MRERFCPDSAVTDKDIPYLDCEGSLAQVCFAEGSKNPDVRRVEIAIEQIKFDCDILGDCGVRSFDPEPLRDVLKPDDYQRFVKEVKSGAWFEKE